MVLQFDLRLFIRSFILTFFEDENVLSSRQKWVLGLFNLSSVVIFWVLSSFLVNFLTADGLYRKPFFITYINTACFSFYLIPYLRHRRITIPQFVNEIKEGYRMGDRKAEDTLPIEIRTPEDELTGLLGVGSMQKDEDLEFKMFETIKLSLQFVVLWFLANLVTNASLSYTSVASQTILSSTSSFFTLLIGYLYAVEKINSNKIIGIVLSFTGVLIVTKIDSSSDNPKNSNLLVLFGNLLALSGALVYGIYTILLKLKTSIQNSTKERHFDTHLFFGFVGLSCLVCFWPFLIILHLLGYEKFELPQNSETWTMLLMNAFVTYISDFCWCKAVILTSPLTATVGLSMTIPLAMVGDWLLIGFKVNWGYLFGALTVTFGFLIINKDERNDFVTD